MTQEVLGITGYLRGDKLSLRKHERVATIGPLLNAWSIESACGEDTLDLYQQFAAAKTAHEKTIHQRQITATDHQIDQLVYELYGLTADEIGIVEGG